MPDRELGWKAGLLVGFVIVGCFLSACWLWPPALSLP